MASETGLFNKLFSELPFEIQESIKNGKTKFTDNEIDGKNCCLCNDMRISGIKDPHKDFMLTFHIDSQICTHSPLQYMAIILKLDYKHIFIDFSNPPLADTVISLIKPYATSFYPALLDIYRNTLVFPTGTKVVVCKRQYPDYKPCSEKDTQKLCVEITLLRTGHNSSCVCGSCNFLHSIVQDEKYLQCYCSNNEQNKQDNEQCIFFANSGK
jgi:hypothetical protein